MECKEMNSRVVIVPQGAPDLNDYQMELISRIKAGDTFEINGEIYQAYEIITNVTENIPERYKIDMVTVADRFYMAVLTGMLANVVTANMSEFDLATKAKLQADVCMEVRKK